MNDKKDVLRPTIVMYVFVGLVGMWMGGCGTPEQKVARLIKQWQYQDSEVRSGEVYALGI